MDKTDKILLGADHGGYSLKEKIKEFLDKESIPYEDYSPNLDEEDDYPDPANAVAKDVASGKGKGVLICGTGIGVCITANKIHGIRAARVTTVFDAEMAAKHNNANILCLGGRTETPEDAERILKTWLETNFEGGRHERRVNKISDIEKNC